MFRKLSCSFCGKDETSVEKLARGGKKNLLGASAHICNECVSTAYKIMLDPEPPKQGPIAHQGRDPEEPPGPTVSSVCSKAA